MTKGDSRRSGICRGTLSPDVDQEKSTNVCKDKVIEPTGGGLDYLVNNAGRSERSYPQKEKEDQ